MLASQRFHRGLHSMNWTPAHFWVSIPVSRLGFRGTFPEACNQPGNHINLCQWQEDMCQYEVDPHYDGDIIIEQSFRKHFRHRGGEEWRNYISSPITTHHVTQRNITGRTVNGQELLSCDRPSKSQHCQQDKLKPIKWTWGGVWIESMGDGWLHMVILTKWQ